MTDAYIVEAIRTADGRRGGMLSGWHPADLAAAVLDSLVERTGVDPAAIEDVITWLLGGGIALGHLLGASGTKLLATLIHALRARGKRDGLRPCARAVASPMRRSSRRCSHVVQNPIDRADGIEHPTVQGGMT